jgi:hypothetical protein
VERADQKKIRKIEKIIMIITVAVPPLIIIAAGNLIVPLLSKGRDLK